MLCVKNIYIYRLTYRKYDRNTLACCWLLVTAHADNKMPSNRYLYTIHTFTLHHFPYNIFTCLECVVYACSYMYVLLRCYAKESAANTTHNTRRREPHIHANATYTVTPMMMWWSLVVCIHRGKTLSSRMLAALMMMIARSRLARVARVFSQRHPARTP